MGVVKIRGRHTLRVDPAPVFLPVRVTGRQPPSAADRHRLPVTPQAIAPATDARIEITLADGTTIRTGTDVSLAALRRVIAAVRG